ncbi:MAG: GNAT family N-acetyltransferase [Chloroflexales bacterium]
MGTPAPFHIRDARDDEHAAIRDLTLGAYAIYAELMPPAAWDGLRQALLGALAADGPVERMVAEQAGALIGSVLLFPPAAHRDSAGGRMIWPELRLLAVAPAARGQGVGAALVAACIARARASGVPTLGLYSSDLMSAAVRLYTRLGFARAPEYDFHPPGGGLVQAFRLTLDSP